MIDTQEAVMEAVPVDEGRCRRGARSPQGVRAARPQEGPLRQAHPRRPRRRHVHDRAGRDRRDPRPERLGEVDARPPALDAPPPGRRLGADPRPRRRRGAPCRAAAREPRLGRGVVLQEDVGRREPELRGALLRHDVEADTREKIPEILGAGRLPAGPARRADGEPFAWDAAEGRARARPPHLAGRAPARRADDGPRSSLEARGAGVHPRDPRRRTTRRSCSARTTSTEAEALAERVGILDRGKLLALEPADDLKRRYGAETLEEAFFAATGREFEAEVDEDGTTTGRCSHESANGTHASRARRSRRRRRAQRLPHQALHLVGRRLVLLDRREHAHDRLHRPGHRVDRRRDRRQLRR